MLNLIGFKSRKYDRCITSFFGFFMEAIISRMASSEGNLVFRKSYKHEELTTHSGEVG
jgi:hypothetical protein